LLPSPPQPAGLRTCDGTTFASFEKYASHFSNPTFGVTEPKEVPYTSTGEEVRNKYLVILFLALGSRAFLKLYFLLPIVTLNGIKDSNWIPVSQTMAGGERIFNAC
jgi:hypothetical protein